MFIVYFFPAIPQHPRFFYVDYECLEEMAGKTGKQVEEYRDTKAAMQAHWQKIQEVIRVDGRFELHEINDRESMFRGVYATKFPGGKETEEAYDTWAVHLLGNIKTWCEAESKTGMAFVCFG